MDPKGKGMVINDKEKETLYVNEPIDDKPTDSMPSKYGIPSKSLTRVMMPP
jgi:hypothetical protein